MTPLRLLTLLLLAVVSTSSSAQIVYVDNGVVRVGADLTRGGAIAHIGPSGSSSNVVNVHDLGRYVQQSWYSGPDPFVPAGSTQHPAYPGWGWNPVQAGDVYRFPSTTLESHVHGDSIHVRSVPKQWALDGVDTACTLDTWIHLDGNRIHFRGRLVNARPDTTRYPARHQELPAVYTVGTLHRLFTYTGDAPFTGDALTQIENSGPPWAYWDATENWSALVDDAGWGLGVVHPGAQRSVGGFSGIPNTGDPYRAPTGYIAPLHTEVIDHDIVIEYEAVLVLGTLEEIRAEAIARRRPPGPQLDFARDRQHCVPRNLTDDAPPYDGAWNLTLDAADPQILLPPARWSAAAVPRIAIDAAFTTSATRAELFFAGPDQAFSGTRRVEIPIVGDGVRRTIDVDLSAHPRYTGAIARLRFDPVATPTTGDVVRLYAIRSATGTDAPASAAHGVLLETARPNPFNPRTTIRWSLDTGRRVSVDVLDPSGRLVKRLVDGRRVAPGRHEVIWKGDDDAGRPVASGVYHVRLRAGDERHTTRVTLVR